MNRSVTAWDWRPGAIATALILAAASVAGGTWIGLLWLSNTDDYTPLIHSLLLAAALLSIAVDIAYIVRTGRRLYREYRRQPCGS